MSKAYKSAAKLETAVEGYFRSISRTVTATEEVWRGEVDEKGHKLMEQEAIHNDAGEPIRYREYVLPPTVWGLCEYLGISRETWERYSDGAQYPQFREAVARARGLLQDWNQRALLTRKDVRGIIFSLQNALDGSAGQENAAEEQQPLSLSARRALLEEPEDR